MIHVEIRKKIVSARERGLTVPEICRAFEVKPVAVFRLFRKLKETGSIEPQTHLRGRKPALNAKELDELRKLLLAESDITLEEVKERLGLSISLSAIHRIIRNKLNFRYKKRQYTQANATDLR